MAYLETLGKQYYFDYYTQSDNLVLMHRPLLSTTHSTDISKDTPIVLDTNNMRANPKLSPAQIHVVSNLDGDILPSNIIDITKLLVVGVDSDEKANQVVEDFLDKTTLDYPLYQTITVQHRGSNYTPLWETNIYGVAPSNSQTMPVNSLEGGM
jgi:hypothetical protein